MSYVRKKVHEGLRHEEPERPTCLDCEHCEVCRLDGYEGVGWCYLNGMFVSKQTAFMYDECFAA